jgi:DNA-directed RNA polymerase III subunit RPC4
MRPNRLFLFQFPAPFPTFVMPPTASTTKAKAKSDSDPDPDVVMAAGGPVPESGSDAAATPILAEGAKRVAFAADVKLAASGASGASSSKKPSKSSEDKKPTIGVGPAEGTSAGDGDSEGQGEPTAPVLDGVIGEMEIRRSGAVTMRMGDGRIVYEVSLCAPAACILLLLGMAVAVGGRLSTDLVSGIMGHDRSLDHRSRLQLYRFRGYEAITLQR